MSKTIASIGDHVYYREVKSEVHNIAFHSPSDDFEDTNSTASDGSLHYLIHNVEFGKHWVLYSECDLVTDDENFFGGDVRSPHLEELGYAMVGWLDGLEDRSDNPKLPSVVTLLMAIQYDKEGSYGSSWKGKGEYRGIMANIDRKYDRLDKMTQDEIQGNIESLAQLEGKLERLKNNTGNTIDNGIGESKIDAIADLANYTLLYLTYVKEHFPRVFQVWVDKNIPSYLRDKIPFLRDAN